MLVDGSDVLVRWRLRARLRSSTASSRARGGQAATATPKALVTGAEAMFAQRDSEMPNMNADQAAQRLEPSRLGFQSSTVAMVRRPSTMSGQMEAVMVSLPKRRANWRPWM
ncbi:hypothetical protein SD37_30470 [Amycolatopsis orientalis]|uniref:Uncharacterized protein n=1 Tax=Amycolatopsis orientalis TaxID=31958 RepID=A0A193C572_AMYOR|nr:hypothetical protein SD37_30470 [Amycolatopsis orientalis]